MMDKKLIAVLVLVVAIVVGYLFLYRGGPQKETLPGETSESEPAVRELTAEEKAVLQIPGPDASEAQVKEHFELVQKLAQSLKELNVTDCALEPLVLNISDDIVVINNGEGEVRLDLANRNYTVPPKDSITIERASLVGGGLYGYGCNTADPSLPPGTGTGLILLGVE